jgi:hypothetical protein
MCVSGGVPCWDYTSVRRGIMFSPLAESWTIAALKTRQLPEINKPQARISGVEISMYYPIDSDTCIEVTTHMTVSCLGLLPDSFKITWFWDFIGKVCMEGSGTHGRWNQPLAVRSAEYLPTWEQIPQQLTSRVKGV